MDHQLDYWNRITADAARDGVDVTDKVALSAYARKALIKDMNGDIPTSMEDEGGVLLVDPQRMGDAKAALAAAGVECHEVPEWQPPTSMWEMDRRHNEFDPRVAAFGAGRLGTHPDIGNSQYGTQHMRGLNHLSMFEGSLADKIIRLFSNPDDIVLDPFSGRITRMARTIKSGRRYYGFDISDETCAENTEMAQASGWLDGRCTIKHANVLTCDETDLPKDAGLVFTCPPYWNTEWYGDNGEGIEGTPDYFAFLEEMVAILARAGRCLREDGYIAVVLKDFHYRRTMFAMHADLIRGMTACGYVLHDIIVKEMSTVRKRFHADVIKWRRTAQVHEYVVVFTNRPTRPCRDLTRIDVYEANPKRQAREAELKARRRAVLAEFGVTDASAMHPFIEPKRTSVIGNKAPQE
jgi:DNA modification methylase